MAHAVHDFLLMNQALPSFTMPVAGRATSAPRSTRRSPQNAWTRHEEAGRLRRLRSLLALFSLYAAALFTVVVVSEGADIGCLLAGIAGHVLYATHRVAISWRDAASLEGAKVRATLRFRPRFA